MSWNRSSLRAFALAILLVPLLAAPCETFTEPTDAVSAASPAAGALPISESEIAPVEGGRRALVVYFSEGEATTRVADDLAFLLHADVERIAERKPRGTGFFGFMGAGMYATFGWTVPIKPAAKDPSVYDIVVVCTPVWSWSLSPPVRAWLRPNRGKLPTSTAYVTVSGDTDPAKIVTAMQKESGREPVAIAGFSESDFSAANRSTYVGKIRKIVDAFR
jgi:hypothetical protein